MTKSCLNNLNRIFNLPLTLSRRDFATLNFVWVALSSWVNTFLNNIKQSSFQFSGGEPTLSTSSNNSREPYVHWKIVISLHDTWLGFQVHSCAFCKFFHFLASLLILRCQSYLVVRLQQSTVFIFFSFSFILWLLCFYIFIPLSLSHLCLFALYRCSSKVRNLQRYKNVAQANSYPLPCSSFNLLAPVFIFIIIPALQFCFRTNIWICLSLGGQPLVENAHPSLLICMSCPIYRRRISLSSAFLMLNRLHLYLPIFIKPAITQGAIVEPGICIIQIYI